MNALKDKSLKIILKFDVGADGFQKMIYVLTISAIGLLCIGIYFLNLFLKDMGQM